jgi:DNA-binding transcriptional LysR family regulator
LLDLESRLGAPLFERTNAGIHPTTIGREFVEMARRIVNEADTAFVRLKARCGGENSPLSIGIYAALSAGNLRATIMEHQRRHPHVEIRAVDGARHHLLAELGAGAVDVVIVTTDDSLWADRKLSLWTERVVVAVPEGHSLCSTGILHWADLRSVPIIFTRRDPGPEFQHLLAVKLGHQNGMRIIQHDVALDRLMSLVGAGLGLTLVAEGATGAVYAGVTYREIHDHDGSPTRLNFMACWRQANDNPALGLRERYPDLAVSSVESGV